MSGVDLLGHACYATLVLALCLIAKKRRVGWLVGAAASLGWVACGAMLDMTSMVVWSTTFAFFYLVNWKQRSEK